VRVTVSVPVLDGEPASDGSMTGALAWSELTASSGPGSFAEVPFAHPLYILYSSGTTGMPKAIMHGHGGILVEHFKMLDLHLDLRAGDRFFWFTTTGWMMWNYLVSGLLVGATVVLFDGDPIGQDPYRLWEMAGRLRVTHFGVSATYLMNCRRLGITPGERHDLRRLRHVGSTGSPLPAEGAEWVYDAVAQSLVLGSASGGSDVCSAFVASSPITRDWIELTERGTCLISGRSDATLNRGGIRTGTAEFYAVVEEHPAVADSLIVHVDATDQRPAGTLVLLVELHGDQRIDASLQRELSAQLRSHLSPRHVPDAIVQVPSIPRTVTGKKLEVPVKRYLQGDSLEQVADAGALLRPQAMRELAAAVAALRADTVPVRPARGDPGG
jgi:acyl-coenzyme A synthetase/AMP-(fatty) acid ligase